MITISERRHYHRFHPARWLGYRIWKLFSYIGAAVVLGGLGYMIAKLV